MKFKKYVSFFIAALSIVACNGGGGGSSGGNPAPTPAPTSTPAPIVVTGESTPIFSNISCMSADITKDGMLTLNSSCPQPVILSNISLLFKSQDTENSEPILFASEATSVDGNYRLSFEQLSANKVGALLSVIAKPEESSNTNFYYINPASKIEFRTTMVSGNIQNFDYNLATSSMEIVKPTDNLELLDQLEPDSSLRKLNLQHSLQVVGATGGLDVGIDTRYTACGKYTNCNGLTVNVLNSDNELVATVRVPEDKIGTAYVARINNLPTGTYSVNVPLLPNAEAKFDNDLSYQVVDPGQIKSPLQVRYQSTVGVLNLVVHTNQAQCNKYDCSSLTVSVVNAMGKLVASLPIPNNAIGGTFTQKVDGLPQGLYNFNVYSPQGFALDLQPKSGMVNVYAQREITTDINIRPPSAVGNVTIKLGKPVNWESAGMEIPLNFQVYNTVNGALVLMMPIKPGQEKPISLPISDSTHKYQAFLTQGFASPANSLFYMQTSPVKFHVTSGGNSVVTLAPIANQQKMKLSAEKVKFDVAGLKDGDSVVITADDSFKKFAYGFAAAYPKAQFNNKKFSFPRGSLIALRAKAGNSPGVAYQVNPKYDSLVVTDKSVASFTFSESTSVAAVFNYVPTFNYPYDSLIYIPPNPLGGPIKYFGLNSYVVTNITAGDLTNISYDSATLPSGISIDDSRTTCNKITKLEKNQTCVIVFKYAPTTPNEWSSFAFNMAFKNQNGDPVYSSVINIPYSSRAR